MARQARQTAQTTEIETPQYEAGGNEGEYSGSGGAPAPKTYAEYIRELEGDAVV